MGATSEIKKYLHSPEFLNKLVQQYRGFEILSEGGLRTAVVNLLRAKIRALGQPAKGYCVTCETRLRLPDAQVVPDLLIWKGKHPRIWIELKDTRGLNRWRAEHDWKKLQDYCLQCSTVKAGFFIYVARINSGSLTVKRGRQTLRLWPIPIVLEPHIQDFERWEQEYRRREHYMPAQRRARPA